MLWMEQVQIQGCIFPLYPSATPPSPQPRWLGKRGVWAAVTLSLAAKCLCVYLWVELKRLMSPRLPSRRLGVLFKFHLNRARQTTLHGDPRETCSNSGRNSHFWIPRHLVDKVKICLTTKKKRIASVAAVRSVSSRYQLKPRLVSPKPRPYWYWESNHFVVLTMWGRIISCTCNLFVPT